MTSNDILQTLCHSQPLAVLATASGTSPYASLVAVAMTTDLQNLYFTTPRATHKFNNLVSNGQVALLIDNRSNQVEDFRQAAAATMIGTAEELTGAEKGSALETYLARHPHLSEFARSQEAAVFRVRIERINMVSGFQDVTEFDFSK
jgi:heme iron utilization protein